jgi:hypothetical protein
MANWDRMIAPYDRYNELLQMKRLKMFLRCLMWKILGICRFGLTYLGQIHSGVKMTNL